jgi:hypothetical protein
MSEDLFEAFEGKDDRNRKPKKGEGHRKHHDDDEEGDFEFSGNLKKHLPSNKWALFGLVFGGIVLIGILIVAIIFAWPYLVGVAKTTNAAEVVKTIGG